MPLRLPANAQAQTTIALPLTSGATSFVGGSTAGFTSPQSFGNGQGSLTILDAGNVAWNPAAPLATPYEYAYYGNNNTGTNTISGLTRGVASTTAHAFSAGAIVAQGFLVEDILASSTWKFDEQNPTSGSAITIPASGTIPSSYLGIPWRHIEIEWTARTNSANNGDLLLAQFNLDAGLNYDYLLVAATGTGFGTTPALSTGTPSIRVGVAAGGLTAAGIANRGIIEIPDAFEVLWRKLVMARCARNDAAAFGRDETTADWHPTVAVAITSITLSVGGGSYVTGSRFTTRLKP